MTKEWVKISDRRPKKEGKYLTLLSTSETIPQIVMNFCSFIDEEWHFEKFDNLITHWMNLPEPPPDWHGKYFDG